MRLVPRDKVPQIEFYERRVAAWADRAEEIGISVEEVEALEAHVAEARAALRAQQAAQNAARSATMRLNHALAKMKRNGAGIVQRIRAAAAQPGGNDVFVKARIPARRKRSPLGPPGTPYGFTHALRPNGSIALRWRCRNPGEKSGTIYHVYRRTGINGPREFLGVAVKRAFVDQTVRAGTSTVVYEVQSIRSTAEGTVGSHLVHFAAIRTPATAAA